MRQFFKLSIDKLNGFPVKSQNGMFPVEPDVVFDFYLFPKVFIIDGMIDKLASFLTNNVEIQEGAIELDKENLRYNYKYLYVISAYDNAEQVEEDVHIYRSSDNQSLFMSQDLVDAINSFNTDYIISRWT